MNDRKVFPEFGLKGRVEICAAAERTEAERICELREDSDIAVVLELETYNQWSLPLNSSRRFGMVDYARVAMVYAL